MSKIVLYYILHFILDNFQEVLSLVRCKLHVNSQVDGTAHLFDQVETQPDQGSLICKRYLGLQNNKIKTNQIQQWTELKSYKKQPSHGISKLNLFLDLNKE